MTPSTAAPNLLATYPDLHGKVAVITGGSRGIGAETSRAFAAQGAKVVVVGRDPAAVEATVASVAAQNGTAVGVAADCTREEDVARLCGVVEDTYGAVDILLAFAGGNGMPLPTHTETVAHWREVVDGELTSSFLTVGAFLPGMLARRSGSIVLMASSAARQAARSSAAYAAAKAGVIALGRHLAGEYGEHGIRVNCLAPSAVENDRMRTWMTQEQRDALGATFPLGRIGQPGDIAAAALFLSSSASSWITGVTLDISGGKVML
jgi:3-oxoacyl-[acyl-carrier protein] reductase